MLLATGTSAVGPLGWFRRRIVPVGAFMIVTEPLPVELLDRLTPTPPHDRSTRATSSNLLPSSRRTTACCSAGARGSPASNPKSDAKSGAILRRSMVDVFPELAGRPDRLLLGRHGRHDARPPAARRRARRSLLLDGLQRPRHAYVHARWARSWPRCSTARPISTPGAISTGRRSLVTSGKPWFLPIVGAYYRYQDFIR